MSILIEQRCVGINQVFLKQVLSFGCSPVLGSWAIGHGSYPSSCLKILCPGSGVLSNGLGSRVTSDCPWSGGPSLGFMAWGSTIESGAWGPAEWSGVQRQAQGSSSGVLSECPGSQLRFEGLVSKVLLESLGFFFPCMPLYFDRNHRQTIHE